MSLARTFTKRIKRSDGPKEGPVSPTRSQSVRNPVNIDRSQISLPVALVSTTNMLSYNAPDLATMDIAAMRKVSSSNSLGQSSAEDSDRSVSTRSRASSHGSRDTLTDASSVESSPTSPAPNHLSGYFSTPGKTLKKSASTASLQQVKEETSEPIPAIPSRALSHSKRAHERLAHKRSLQNFSSSSNNSTRGSINSRGSTSSLRHSHEQRSSLDMFRPTPTTITEEAPQPQPQPPHPFGRELAQLNEVVEEFGGVVRDAETEADLSAMRVKKLASFCAADYLAEIEPLVPMRFGFARQQPAMAWI